LIEEIEIANFKAFSTAWIRFGRYTLLSGLNSSGKSTVLQALAVLRQAGPDLYADPDGPGGLALNGDLVQLGTGRDVLHESYEAAPDTQPEIGFRLTTQDSREHAWRFRYGPEADFLHMTYCSPSYDAGPWAGDEDSLDQARETPSIFREGFQYLKADRINPAVTYPRSYEMSVRRGFLGTRGEYAIDYLLHHQDEPVAAKVLHPSGASPRLLAQAEAWMGEICPGVRIQAAAIEQTDLARLSFQFAQAGQLTSEQRRPTNVGFGLTYVLPVVIACLTAKPDALLLLENPEAHIHPQGQSAMARLTCAAAAAGAQVIVETHSDHILNGVRLAVKRELLAAEDVVLQYFQRGDGGISILSPAMGPDGMLSQWPPGFFDEWDRSLDQLLDS
jgi:predicted ATPase